MTDRGHVVRLRAHELRRVFNDSGIWERRLGNQLLEVVLRDADPDPANNQPPGTRSIAAQIVELDNNLRRRVVAIVHYYKLPDGSINNAAGLPDPKMCVVDGVQYTLRP